MTDNPVVRIEQPTSAERCDRLRARLGCADGLVGHSAAMARLLEQMVAVADREVDVLLLGPTGVGKTEVAHVLHAASRRAAGPFVAVECGALVSTLAESTLFGHERGAFTGAERSARGHVAAAEGGTLFLDEVGDLDPVVQPKLLTLLAERRYRVLGRTGERQVANVRVVSATHRDLDDGFRSDLYERLARYRIRVPSLAERAEDIPHLARWLLARQARREGLRPLTLTADAVSVLLARAWPRNVRELDNALVAADVEARARGRSELRAEDLDETPRNAEGSRSARLEAFDRMLIEEHLRETRYDVPAAARLLGMARSSLYDRIRILNIELHADACDVVLLNRLRDG